MMHTQLHLLPTGLDWLSITDASRLYGLEADWLARELVFGRLPAIHWKLAAGAEDNPLTGGVLLWQPSLEIYVQTHRELLVGGMTLLRRNGGSA